MMTLYKNKYRVESTRLKGWDYSKPWRDNWGSQSNDSTEYIQNHPMVYKEERHLKSENQTLISHGNPVFMTASSVMKMN